MANLILAISNHDDFLGGGEHSYLELITHLPGDEPVIACVPAEGPLSSMIREKGIAVSVVPMPPINPFGLVQAAKSVLSLAERCRRSGIDLIYANGSRAAFYGALAGRFRSVPVVWHCRVIEPDPCLDFILARMVDRIVVNSRATSRRFPDRFRDKTDVIYNGFNLSWLEDAAVEKPDWVHDEWLSILVVARVSRWKRHDLALTAFEKVAAVEKRAHLICLGEKDPADTAWWNTLQNMTAASPFRERVHWAGHVSDVRPWYRAASALVLPSVNEPFGRVVVEAMASGVPVIATGSGGIPEIITHLENGVLVPENQAEAIAEALLLLLEDAALCRRIAAAARQRAKAFSLDSHVEKMTGIFNTLSHGDRRS
jgi:glycosyltransferase involved in cell wall biosynthesis